MEVATGEGEIRAKLLALEKRYASVPKAKTPHPDIGCWWTIYDYGLERVKTWAPDYKHPYPEELKRARDVAARKAAKEEHRKAKAAALAAGTLLTAKKKAPVPSGPIAFLFPGQGSQAVGMLNQSKDIPAVKEMLATAEQVLGYDLLALCTEGPKEKLDDTVYSQVSEGCCYEVAHDERGLIIAIEGILILKLMYRNFIPSLRCSSLAWRLWRSCAVRTPRLWKALRQRPVCRWASTLLSSSLVP